MEQYFVYIIIFLLSAIGVLLIQILSQLKYLTTIVYKILNNSPIDNIDKNVSSIKEKQIPMNDKLRNIQNVLSADRADKLGYTPNEDDC